MAKPSKKLAEEPGIGHNSQVSGTRIKSFVGKIERLEEQKHSIGLDIKDVYTEAKSAGFDAPTIRKLVSERKKSAEKRQEQYSLFELYSAAIGMA